MSVLFVLRLLLVSVGTLGRCVPRLRSGLDSGGAARLVLLLLLLFLRLLIFLLGCLRHTRDKKTDQQINCNRLSQIQIIAQVGKYDQWCYAFETSLLGRQALITKGVCVFGPCQLKQWKYSITTDDFGITANMQC